MEKRNKNIIIIIKIYVRIGIRPLILLKKKKKN